MARPNSASAIAGHVAGLREAKAAFQALPAIVRDNLLGATDTTLREIVRQAKANLQASPSVQTRALLNAVNFTLNKNSGRGKAGIANVTSSINVGGRNIRVKGIVKAGRGGSALTSQGAKLIKPTRYAHLVEFGSKHMRAEPFMIPAARSQERPYLERCRAAGREIERNVASVGMRNL